MNKLMKLSDYFSSCLMKSNDIKNGNYGNYGNDEDNQLAFYFFGRFDNDHNKTD